MTEATLIAYAGKLTREQLARVPTPQGTLTHKPVPHIDIVQAIIETLGFRHIGVVRDEYAVSRDGCGFSGSWNWKPNSMDVGLRWACGIPTTARCGSPWWSATVAVCENMMFSGVQPVLAKHSKNFSLVNALSSASIRCSEFRADEAAIERGGIAAGGRRSADGDLPGIHRRRAICPAVSGAHVRGGTSIR
jgi:hypothetical protein